ncbi:hypothetical protein KI387_010471, partial [Taxus chinensis]
TLRTCEGYGGSTAMGLVSKNPPFSWIDLAFNAGSPLPQNDGANPSCDLLQDTSRGVPVATPSFENLKSVLEGSVHDRSELDKDTSRGHIGSSFKNVLNGKESSMKPADITPSITLGEEVISYEIYYKEHALICRFGGLWPSLPILHAWISEHWTPILTRKIDLYPCAK